MTGLLKPFRFFSDFLRLARYRNVNVKLCGVPALSLTPYPYDDVWPHVRELVDQFGAERLMWASDIGRFQGRIGWPNVAVELADSPGKHTYGEALGYIRRTDALTLGEKELVLGGTACALLGWRPAPRDLPAGDS
jgi:hypothetical protein